MTIKTVNKIIKIIKEIWDTTIHNVFKGKQLYKKLHEVF